MNRALLVIFLLVASCGFSQAQTAEDSVRQVFKAYESAILRSDAEAAAELVDTTTLDYYFGIAQQAMYAEKKDLQGLSLVDKVSILSVRVVASYQELKKLDRVGVFVFLFNEGLVNSYSENVDLGKVKANDNLAMAAIDVNHSIYLFFTKENGLWKINLSITMAAMEVYLNKYVQDTGLTEEEFMEMTAKDMNAALTKGNIYTPLDKRK